MKTDRDDAFIGTCDHCGKKNVELRRILARGRMFNEPRGYYSICFECFGERVIWSKRGKTMKSPLRIEGEGRK